MAEQQHSASDSNTRRKRVSKKSKKSWRKHTDITDVEEHLEEVRQEERTGGAAADKADEELFCVDNDVTETEKAREKTSKKTLTCHKFLQQDTHVPAILGKKRKKDKRVRKNSSSDDNDDEPVVKKRGNKAVSDNPQETASSDLWVQPEDEKPEEDNEYLTAALKAKVNKPDTVGRKTSGVMPVEVCHPGASYNPTYEDHQALLQAANEVELKKVKEEEKIKRQLKFPSAEEFANNPTWEEEMSQGLFGDDEKEENEADSEEEEEDGGTAQPVRAENRKTRKQRNKEIVLKEESKKAQSEKNLRKKVNEVYRLKSLKKEIVQGEKKSEERLQKKLELEEKYADKPKRLGREKYVEPYLEIQLSDELTGNLRNLKPEGNIFVDRYKSLQKRNIIEPRKPAKKHRKFPLKTYEKRSYKRKCVKEFASKVLGEDS